MIEVIRGHNPTIPSPILRAHNALSLSMARSEHHSPVDRLWRLIAQWTFLGGRYIGDILAIANNVMTPCF